MAPKPTIGTKHMTPQEAANLYMALEAAARDNPTRSNIGAAIRFAHEYEDSANEDDYETYLVLIGYYD